MRRAPLFITGLLAIACAGVQAQDSRLRNGSIAYVMTDLFWSVYQTADGRQECPRGFNDGPREHFTTVPRA